MGIKKAMKNGIPFWGKLCLSAVCAALVMSVAADSTIQLRAVGESSIESLEQKAKQLQEENEKRRQQIASLGEDIDENKNLMDLVNNQVDGVINEIDTFSQLITVKQEEVNQKLIEIADIENTIAKNEAEIEVKKQKIIELEKANQENLEKFGKLARYMYMNNTSSQLPVLNGSDDWYDYFVYSDVVKNISSQNYEFMKELQASIDDQKRLIAELDANIESLENERAELEVQRKAYESEAANLASEKRDLESYADQKRQYLNELASENEDLQNKIGGLEYAIAEANEEREQLNLQIEELIRQAQQSQGDDGEEQIDYSGDGLRWPLNPSFHLITDYFGYQAWRNGIHHGIDIGDGGIQGQSILAAQSGTVLSVSYTCNHNQGKNYNCGCGSSYGNYFIVDHGGGISTLYAHCQAIYVTAGQHVEKGQALGEVGSTGWSTGPHLHFEVRKNGVAVNPFDYVSY